MRAYCVNVLLWRTFRFFKVRMCFSNHKISNCRYSYVQLFYQMIHSFLIEYPSAYNITYFWNFGFLAAIFSAVQIISGVFLVAYYTPELVTALFNINFLILLFSYVILNCIYFCFSIFDQLLYYFSVIYTCNLCISLIRLV